MPFYKERTVRRRHHGHCPEARAHHQQRVASTLDSFTLQCHCFSKKPWTLSNVEVDDLVEKNMLLDEKVALTLVKVGDMAKKAAELEDMLRDLGAAPLSPLPADASPQAVQRWEEQAQRLEYLRSQRELICSQHSVYTGSLYLHLKYLVVLKNDLQVVSSLLEFSRRNYPAKAGLSIPDVCPRIMRIDHELNEAISGVGNLASLHLYNWYAPQGDEDEEDDDDGGPPAQPYSLVKELLRPFENLPIDVPPS